MHKSQWSVPSNSSHLTKLLTAHCYSYTLQMLPTNMLLHCWQWSVCVYGYFSTDPIGSVVERWALYSAINAYTSHGIEVQYCNIREMNKGDYI